MPTRTKEKIYTSSRIVSTARFTSDSQSTPQNVLSSTANQARQKTILLLIKQSKSTVLTIFGTRFLRNRSKTITSIMPGGEQPPVHYAIDHPNSTFDGIEEVHQIKKELRETQLSLSEIAKNHNTSKRTVMRINQGLHYEELNETYPIRLTPNMNGKLTDDQVIEIIELLRYSYRQYEDIGAQYGISISAVKQINSGDCHPITGVEYPIRRYKNSGNPACTYRQVTEISMLLSDTKMSCRQIAKCYDVDLQTVYIINNGSAKRYRRDDLKYPLRKHNTGRRPCIDYPR